MHMKTMLLAGLLACTLAGPVAAADEARLSSNTDFSAAGARDLPVTCKRGDEQPFQGKTMAQVFGEAWPVAPAATASHAPPEVLTSGRLVPPRGLEGKSATVVVAVLVGADGKGIASEAVCATSSAFVTAAKRVLRSASFRPAMVDGVAVTSVAAVPIVFRAGRSRTGGSSDSNGGDQD
jgi:hypothetical protein